LIRIKLTQKVAYTAQACAWFVIINVWNLPGTETEPCCCRECCFSIRESGTKFHQQLMSLMTERRDASTATAIDNSACSCCLTAWDHQHTPDAESTHLAASDISPVTITLVSSSSSLCLIPRRTRPPTIPRHGHTTPT